MATLTEIVDLDSGVASSEATPEGQTVIAPAEEAAKMVLTGEDILEVAKEIKAEADAKATAEDDKKKADDGPTPAATSSVVVAAAAAEADDEDEDDDADEDVDESFGERLLALSEMFPDRLRSASSNAVSASINLMKTSYNVTRQVVWIAVSTSIILFAPVMFELERLNVEEMMKQDRNRLVLGPGSAVSAGAGAPGSLMPPPPTR